MKTSSVANILSLILLAGTLGLAHAQTPPAAGQASASSAAAAETANTWLVTASGTATSEGIVGITVTPWDIEPITVAVKVTKGESANMVAVNLRDAFRKALDQNTFRVDMEGKQAIRVLAKHGDHRFGIRTTEATASGVDVALKKEK
ncbi:hypothetical protein LK996_13370 [Lysobacter sp. A6]|uniref:Uncharacterized protein n=1 Tax=Noviluteimonas lactosilytica TaxID=2888523 RepID=A0ABS8JKE8_9GAMM|nr:hypothetical protein [Lysobacter lactosilyticus]MCC8364062.1 hypothetical protein [Lysobacter lactosilyticus]